MSSFNDTFNYTSEDLIKVTELNEMLVKLFQDETFRITICSILAFMDKVSDVKCKESMIKMVNIYVAEWQNDLADNNANQDMN